MAESLTQKTFRGFFWQFGGTIFKTVIQLGVLFVLARLISKADFGIVQSALVVVGLSKLVSQMGVGPALVQKETLTSLHIRSGATISLFLSIISFLIVFFSSGLLADFFKMPELTVVLKVVAVLFVLEGITTVSQSLLLREMRQKALAKIDFLSYSVGYGLVAIVLAYYDFGLWSLIFAQLTQSTIKCISSYIVSRHSILPFFGKKEAKELLYFGGGFTLAKLFSYLALQGDNIITGRYIGADALGVYSRAYSLMVKPVSLIGDSIDKALFPAMSARQNQKNRLIEAFINGARLITFLALPISCILILSANELIIVALGDKWVDAIIPFQILTAGLLFRIGYKMGDCLCRATGRIYSKAMRSLIYAICILLGSYIGSKWGIIGVAYGTLFAVIVNYILLIQLSLSILGISWLYYLRRVFKEFLMILLSMIIFYCIITFIRSFIESKILILLSSYSIFAIIILSILPFIIKRFDFLEILPFKNIIKKIKR